MLRGDPRRGAVGPPKDDRAAHLAAGHVEGLGGGVDELVHRLHGEIEGHELDDRPQTAEGGTDAKPGEAVRSEEHTSELQSLMRISYAVFCLTKKKTHQQ